MSLQVAVGFVYSVRAATSDCNPTQLVTTACNSTRSRVLLHLIAVGSVQCAPALSNLAPLQENKFAMSQEVTSK